MKCGLQCTVLVALMIFGMPQQTPLAPETNVQLAGNKNCRLVDMCWIKNGKRYCFKKRVCD